jgi:hypothetical protein
VRALFDPADLDRITIEFDALRFRDSFTHSTDKDCDAVQLVAHPSSEIDVRQNQAQPGWRLLFNLMENQQIRSISHTQTASPSRCVALGEPDSFSAFSRPLVDPNLRLQFRNGPGFRNFRVSQFPGDSRLKRRPHDG